MDPNSGGEGIHEIAVRTVSGSSLTTRSAVSGTTFPAGYDMVVSAYRNNDALVAPDDASKNYFEGIKFTKGEAVWHAATPKYWPLTGNLDLLAIAGSGLNTAANGVVPTFVWNTDNVAGSVVATIPDNSAKFDDILFGGSNAQTYMASGNPIVFRHAESAVVFTASSNVAYNAETNVGVTIDSISVNGAKYSGTLTVTNPAAGMTEVKDSVVAAWSDLGSEKAYIKARVWNTANTGVDAAESVLTALNLTATSATLASKPFGEGYVILPEQDAVPFTVTYTIHNGKDASGSAVNNQMQYKYVPEAGSKWEQGKKHVYDIIINLSEVTIAPTVVDWDNNIDSAFAVKFSSNDEEKGTVSSTNSIVVPGSEVIKLTATPKEGCEFILWKDEEGNIISKEAKLFLQATPENLAKEYTAMFIVEGTNQIRYTTYDHQVAKWMVYNSAEKIYEWVTIPANSQLLTAANNGELKLVSNTYDSVNDIGILEFAPADSKIEGDCAITRLDQFCESLPSSGSSNGFSNFKDIILPSSVKTIGWQAFGFDTGRAEGRSFNSIVLPEGLETIEAQAFANCCRLASIEIPSTVTAIADDAFYNCVFLEDGIVNKTSLSSDELIANYFMLPYDEGGCGMSEEVVRMIFTDFENNWGSPNHESFGAWIADTDMGVDGLRVMYYEDENIEGIIGYTGNAENLIIPEGAENIFCGAFVSNQVTKSITMPSTMKVIDCGNFACCSALEELNLNEGLEKLTECIQISSPRGFIDYERHFGYTPKLRHLELPSTVETTLADLMPVSGFPGGLTLDYLVVKTLNISFSEYIKLCYPKSNPFVNNCIMYAPEDNIEALRLSCKLTLVDSLIRPIVPADEIWYTTTDDEVATPSETYMANYGRHIISNTNVNGKGIIKFDEPVQDVTRIFAGEDVQSTNLKTIQFPEGLPAIGGPCVDGSQTGLVDIMIPCVSSIGDYAFKGAKVEKIIIPRTVSYIGREAFVLDSVEPTIYSLLCDDIRRLYTLDCEVVDPATCFTSGSTIIQYNVPSCRETLWEDLPGFEGYNFNKWPNKFGK